MRWMMAIVMVAAMMAAGACGDDAADTECGYCDGRPQG